MALLPIDSDPGNKVLNKNQLQASASAIEDVPFTEKDIIHILKIASECPVDDYEARTVRQHIDICWNDAMFTMLFEADGSKQIFLSMLEELLNANLKFDSDLGYGLLIYDYQTTHTEKMKIISKIIYDKFIEINIRGNKQSINWIKQVLPNKVMIMTLALQRYALLNYMFYRGNVFQKNTNVDSAAAASAGGGGGGTPIPNQNNGKSALFKRRKSIQHSKFNTFLYRQSCGGGLESSWGLSDVRLSGFVNDISLILTYISDYPLKLYSWDNDVSNETTVGYYLVLKRNWYDDKHVVSLFKCNTKWFFYDNEQGMHQMSDDDSNHLTHEGIYTMLSYVENKSYHYIIVTELGNKIQFSFSLAQVPTPKIAWYTLSHDVCRRLAPKVNQNVAAAGGGGGAAAAGGGGGAAAAGGGGGAAAAGRDVRFNRSARPKPAGFDELIAEIQNKNTKNEGFSRSYNPPPPPAPPRPAAAAAALPPPQPHQPFASISFGWPAVQQLPPQKPAIPGVFPELAAVFQKKSTLAAAKSNNNQKGQGRYRTKTRKNYRAKKIRHQTKKK